MPASRTARLSGPSRTGRSHPGRAAASTRASRSPIGNRAMGRMLAADGRLSGPLRDHFESAFDTDLGALRVRVSPEASRYDAHALTRGSEIVFAPGKLDLSTTTGRVRMGHEIAHSIQQSAGRVQADGRYAGAAISRSRALERQAHGAGEAIDRGGRVEAGLRGHSLRPGRGAVMQRDVDPAREAKIVGMEDEKVMIDGYPSVALAGTTDTYKIGLWVYVDHPLFETMYQARTPMVAERKAREKVYKAELARDKKLSALERKSLLSTWQTTEKAKEKEAAARSVLPETASDEEVKKLVDASTGHTWLEFNRYEGSKRLCKYTYGFSTIAGRLGAKETAAGKSHGVVKNPDNYARPQKGTVRWFEVTGKQYKDALKKALAIKENPPRYSLTGDNCTSFAKNVLEAGGQTFPSRGYPIGWGGVLGTVHSPSKLFTAMTAETEL